MNLTRQLEAELQQLNQIGTFPTDYTLHDLIRYTTVLGALAYRDRETIDRLKARVRELEGRQQQVT
ncbi:hypothetical protein PWR63_20140 [Paraburkholderia sp. A2WS-5]|uniref:hypothetical protein n=1 Tax=unclassified Paraburkholderia TaxID=2615204 RepID=UPI003B7FBAB9